MTVRFVARLEEVDVVGWSGLVESLPETSVFCLPTWASVWWATLGMGSTRVAIAEDRQGITAVVPLFELGDMLFLIGCVGADHLDIAWERGHNDVLEEVLAAVFTTFPNIVGLQLHQLKRDSDTTAALARASARLGLIMTEDDQLSAPFFSLTPERVTATTAKKSLRRHENWFRQNGELRVDHLRAASDVENALPAFFDQHIRRWAGTAYPSLFEDHRNRRFYECLVQPATEEGWLRFTRVLWNERPIAYHYGFCLGGRYLWYKPSFEIELSEHSPGEVLLRHLIWAAADEGAAVFDFGLGQEPFKDRFSESRIDMVTIGIYPGQDTIQ